MQSTISRRNFLQALAIGAASTVAGSALYGCSGGGQQESSSASDADPLAIDNAKWNYDADNDVYYQIGLPYCTQPVASEYESYGIYVPGAYFTGTANEDGTYTCEVNASGAVGSYTAQTAPIVIPVNTGGYAAQEAPAEYSYDGLDEYLKAGLVYVFAGCRGKSNGVDGSTLVFSGGAPWGVTDLKCAVRALRYNAGSLPGDAEKIFSFGMSGGGAQSALLGVTGDAPGYTAYLEAIGAPMQDAAGNAISDALYGSMCWCPITNLDYASEAYEWNMGQFAETGTREKGTFTAELSKDMAAAWARYVNGLGLKDESGKTLKLKEGGEGIWTKGSYYEHIMGVVEGSLNNFLADTEFPYTPSNEFNADMGAGGGGGGKGGFGGPNGGKGGGPNGDGGPQGGPDGKGSPDGNGGPGNGGKPDGEPPSGQRPDGMQGQGAPDGSQDAQGRADGAQGGGEKREMRDMRGGGEMEATTYETVKDYIAHLNEDVTWVKYDSKKNAAAITGLAGFVGACKQPSKDVGAFDALDRSQAENDLFGNDDSESAHFDACMAGLLKENAESYAKLSNWSDAYPGDYAGDLELTDALSNNVQARADLYNPLYYLCGYYDSAGTSTPAKHWRIRTGIEQGDTAVTTEVNLALALAQQLGADAVDFETVWGMGHTMAERTGDSTGNFIAWVEECCK